MSKFWHYSNRETLGKMVIENRRESDPVFIDDLGIDSSLIIVFMKDAIHSPYTNTWTKEKKS
jgi:formyltetrahydrofolate synthetase